MALSRALSHDRWLPVQVGVIGAGGIVTSVHLPVLAAIRNVSVAWVADVSETALRDTSRAFRIPHAHVVNEGFAAPHADIVLLATPVFARRQYLERFGSTGTTVFAEKPFARSAAEHREYLSLPGSSRFYCGFMRRTYASVRALRCLVEEKCFGSLRRVFFSEGGRVTATAHSPRTLDLDFRQGGGVLRDLGCHGIDTILYLTGANDASVTHAEIEWDGQTDRQVNARFTLFGRSCEGCEVDYTVSWLTPQTNRITLEFDNANVRTGIRPNGGLELLQRSRSEWIPFSVHCLGANTFYQAFYLEWLDVLQADTTSTFLASNTIRTTSLVDHIYERGCARS